MFRGRIKSLTRNLAGLPWPICSVDGRLGAPVCLIILDIELLCNLCSWWSQDRSLEDQCLACYSLACHSSAGLTDLFEVWQKAIPVPR